jgi:hypothetical protein
LLWLFWRWGSRELFAQAGLLSRCLPSSKDYKHEPLAPSLNFFLLPITELILARRSCLWFLGQTVCSGVPWFSRHLLEERPQIWVTFLGPHSVVLGHPESIGFFSHSVRIYPKKQIPTLGRVQHKINSKKILRQHRIGWGRERFGNK